jgi:hypothetical protein
MAKTDIHCSALNIKFEIDMNMFPMGCCDPLFIKCENQIKIIELENRINELISDFLFQTFTGHNEIDNNDKLMILINHLVSSYQKKYGVNDWRSAILVALENDHNFTIDFLKLYLNED